MWEMYLPRHNCTVTGTQGVRYCGFPIAMKAWMGTSASLSHVCRTSVGRTESLKGKLCKGSSVGSGKSGYRNWTKELSRLTKLDRLGSFQDVTVYHRVFCPDVYGKWKDWESERKTVQGIKCRIR
ncbi:hypothetical protein F2Q68_00008824 [Brassica cretica]|uniref:Uncharacterized protein n=1 Tax=Brassica cretica TaxID=69181 RepID=A0A8S9KP42_BRACR|nr:hypothetical protein F2Q68_00008824 [Brassica cretica]